MRVLYCAEQRGDTRRSGATIRRFGMINAIRSAGHAVELDLLPNGRGRLGFLRVLNRADAQRISERADSYDMVWIEGLPLHQLCRALAARQRPAVWDVCDSWPRKYLAAWRLERRLVDLIRLVLSVLLLMGSASNRITRLYISSRDAAADSRMVLGRGSAKVVPNGVDVPRIDSSSPGADVVVLGDWAYPPNQRSLEWLDRLARRTDLPSPVVAFGSGLEQVPDYSWLLKAGYQEDLADVFQRARLVLAPVLDGAGVKNKVLEPAAAGIPVVTTQEGGTGVMAPPWVFVSRSDEEFLARWQSWILDPPTIDAATLEEFRKAHSWEAVTEIVRTLLDRS